MSDLSSEFQFLEDEFGESYTNYLNNLTAPLSYLPVSNKLEATYKIFSWNDLGANTTVTLGDAPIIRLFLKVDNGAPTQISSISIHQLWPGGRIGGSNKSDHDRSKVEAIDTPNAGIYTVILAAPVSWIQFGGKSVKIGAQISIKADGVAADGATLNFPPRVTPNPPATTASFTFQKT